MTADDSSIFEKYTVREIEDLLTKTRNDIERKKEDLRIMVGERYRDLIEAADTIAEMQQSAAAVCQKIETMEGLCASLQQRGLIGFKTRVGISQPSVDIHRLSGSSYQYSVAVQVKLLVDAPEILWSLAEKKEYLAASQLLLLVQHSHTVLQLSPNASQVLECFPVISRQWSNISHFKSTIVKGCCSLIRNEIDDCQAVLDAVTAIMFIEGCSMKESLTKVLQLRKSSLESALVVKPSSVAKNQLVKFVVILIASLKIVRHLFAENGSSPCYLDAQIREVSGLPGEKDGSSSWPRPIDLLSESSLMLSVLPKSVLQFRPKLRCSNQTVTNKYLQEEVISWLQSIISEAAASIQQLLNYTTSIKALSLMRNSIWETQDSKTNDEHWKKVVETLLGDSMFSPWQSAIQKQVLERAQVLVSKELHSITSNIKNMVQELATDIKTNDRICHEEGDITDYVWSEASSDLPDQVGWTTAMARHIAGSSEKPGLFYKSRGYTKRIQNVCSYISGKLTHLLEDLFHYAPDSLRETTQKDYQGENKESKEDESAHEDYKKLLMFLQNETLRTFKQVLEELNNVAQEFSAVDESEPDYQWEDPLKPPSPTAESTVIIVISRICHAMQVVCPDLKICAGATLLGNQETARRVTLGVQPDTESWIELRECFGSHSTCLMTQFLTHIAQSLAKSMKQDFIELIQENKPEDLLMIFSSWESIEIEEEGEGGQMIHSSISVPIYPSPPLSQSLLRVCSSVNYICVHTIMSSSQMELVNQLCLQLAAVYESLEPSLDNINQTTALQLIFDLKVVQTLLVTRENKDIGARICLLIEKFETRVDPFDLNVFQPHIASRVKIAATRLQILLGILIPRDKQPLSSRGTQPLSSSSANNSLPLVPSVEVPRFSNVPLPVSLSSKSKILTIGSATDLSFTDSFMQRSITKTPDLEGLPQARSSAVSDVTLSASRSAASLISSWFGGTSS